jgi:hypothetical protein
MAPYEMCKDLPSGQTKVLLDDALRRAQGQRCDGEYPIVSAYRTTQASLGHYPNTGELLAAVIGRDRLHGGITENDAKKHALLEEKWANSDIKAVAASWRAEIHPEGILSCPDKLLWPWLFSADPMTYREEGDANDDKLYRADLQRLAAALKPFIDSGQPGAASLFVYAVKPHARPKFWSFADDLASQIGAVLISAWVTHQGGNRNLAAVFCSPAMSRPSWLPEGVLFGR